MALGEDKDLSRPQNANEGVSSSQDPDGTSYAGMNGGDLAKDHFDELIAKIDSTKPLAPPAASMIPTRVWVKLFGFSALLFILPLSMYYVGYHYLFSHNLIVSAIFSIVIIEAIVGLFIYVALTEDDDRPEKPKTD